MIKKNSNTSIICLACSNKVTGDSEYCEECIKSGEEKLGLEISDTFDEAETLRGGIDKAAKVLSGVKNES